MKELLWNVFVLRGLLAFACLSLFPLFASAELKISSQGELGLEARLFTGGGEGDQGNAVSYTHLTLPTICSV